MIKQVHRPLQSMWLTCVKFQDPGFSLAISACSGRLDSEACCLFVGMTSLLALTHKWTYVILEHNFTCLLKKHSTYNFVREKLWWIHESKDITLLKRPVPPQLIYHIILIKLSGDLYWGRGHISVSQNDHL